MSVMTLAFSLKVLYAALVLIVVSLMFLYVRGLTSTRPVPLKMKLTFFIWLFFLAAVAIIFHLFTAWRVPWVHWEIARDRIKPDKVFQISAQRHQFHLPKVKLGIKTGEMVKFQVTSADLTYGFGVFRRSGAMEFQMQVIPGHENEILWIFSDPGNYSIRSTEYAGPETGNMYMKDVIEVKQ